MSPNAQSASQTDRELYLVEEGNGDELVVFVHGVLDRGSSFRRAAEFLTDRCHMVFYDRRGYGQSLGAASEPVGVDVHTDDLVEVLDGRRAVVVGHSFGGVTVLGAALRHPELFAAVVLYETGMAWLPNWDDRFMIELLSTDDAETAGVRMMFGDRLDTMSPENLAGLLLEGRAFVAEERSVRSGQAPFEVADLQVPLVYGRSESTVFQAVTSHLTRVVRDLEVVELPGAGHNAHRTQPAAFAELVKRGLSKA
jgi:pimeloyl-ACP methyl ester carboxylesterase